MAYTVQHLRSDGENRRPRPDQMLDGQIAINTYPNSAGAFIKTNDDKIAKIGAAYVGPEQPPLSNWSEYHNGETWFNTTEEQLYLWVDDAWVKAGVGDFKPDVVHKGQKGERGSTGATGPNGLKGDPGDSAYEIAQSEGFVGSQTQWVASLKGDKGPIGVGAPGAQGIKGDVGPKGEVGSTGDKGVQGAPGNPGAKGDTGLTGGEGQKGETGDTGDLGEKGEKGDKGLKGQKGEIGDKGDKGVKGNEGLDAYEVAVLGGFSGTRTEWVDSLKGDKGEKGEGGLKGAKGEAGQLFNFMGNKDFETDLPSVGNEIGDVWLVEGDGKYYAWNGTEWVSIADKIQELKGEKGDKGEDGATGLNGFDGASAYEIAVGEGFSGTPQEWLDSLVGQKGENGLKGEDGEKGLDGLDGGKGEIGPKGEKGEPVKGEKGDSVKGEPGMSAYEVAVNNGDPSPDESTWVASLKGEQGTNGDKGEDGKSAYESAQEAGFLGTEGEWVVSLAGDKGDLGEKGEEGEKGPQGNKGATGDKGDIGLSPYDLAVENGFVGTYVEWADTQIGPKGEKGEMAVGVESIIAGDNVTVTPSNGLGDVKIDVEVPPGTVVDTLPPAAPEEGQLWWNSVDGKLYVFYEDDNSSQWVEASPQGVGSGFSQDEADLLHLSKVNDDTAAGAITFEGLTTHEAGIESLGNIRIGEDGDVGASIQPGSFGGISIFASDASGNTRKACDFSSGNFGVRAGGERDFAGGGLIAFQAGYTNTGLLAGSEWVGFDSNPGSNIESHTGLRIRNNPATTKKVGIEINTNKDAPSESWVIHATGNASSYFRGDLIVSSVLGLDYDVIINTETGAQIQGNGEGIFSRSGSSANGTPCLKLRRNDASSNGNFVAIQMFSDTRPSPLGSITVNGNFIRTIDSRLGATGVAMADGAADIVKLLQPKVITQGGETFNGFLPSDLIGTFAAAVDGTAGATTAIGTYSDPDGVVETDVEEPEAIPFGATWVQTGIRDEMQGVCREELIPLITKALQETIAKNEELEARLAALEGA